MNELAAPESPRRIGFVGLGAMGWGMAHRLVNAGHEVTVCNRTRSVAERFVAEHGTARLADDPANATRGAEIVMSSVFDATAVRDVYLGKRGVVGALTSGQVVVETSTIGPGPIIELADAVERRGAQLVDAPVSGSRSSVEAGALLMMAGGPVDAVRYITPAVVAFAASVFHLGPVGAGAAMKLALNSVVYGLNEALSEALIMAERCGIDRSMAYDVFVHSAIAAPSVIYRRPVFEHPGGPVQTFSIEGARKDLRLIQELADCVGSPSGQVIYLSSVLDAAIRAGFASRDVGEVAQFLRESHVP